MDYDKLIDLHFGTLMNYKAASIEHYLKTGTASGTFRSELKAMLKDACEGKAESTSEKDLRVCEVITRFFVDERCGCVAVRDRLHPSYDKDYKGLSSLMEDVISYFHGVSVADEHGCLNWEIEPRLIQKCHDICTHLNGL